METAKVLGYMSEQMRQLRASMEEVVVRGDHLLPEEILRNRKENAGSTHE